MAPNILAYENEDVELLPEFEKKGYRTTPIIYVNGERVPRDVATKARPNQTLLSFLRDDMLLTGSKLGCAEGGCGACTVMLSRANVETGTITHISVNACLMPVLAADGCHITTVEGVGTVKGDNLHPIQKAMVDMHGSQCGFCTPGIIVAIYALFANNPTTAYVEEHLDGNLCRCTGYRPIWDAARSLCTDSDSGVTRGPCGTSCRECPERDECEMECNEQDKLGQKEEKKTESTPKSKTCCSTSDHKISQFKDTIPESKSEWLEQPSNLFPKELLLQDSTAEGRELTKPLIVASCQAYHTGTTWFKPTTLIGILDLLKRFGNDGGCKIIVGNTEVGIEMKFKNAPYSRLIQPSESISNLYDVTTTPTHLEIGACTSLSTLQHRCDTLSKDGVSPRTVNPLHDMLRWFASTQIRNVACLGGNLVTASPISDMNPMLACMNANLIISSLSDTDANTIIRRTVPVSEFFLGYRKVNLQKNELVEKIEVPLLQETLEYAMPFKQARRREDDISIVTAGMRTLLAIKDGGFIVENISISFGGMAPTTILATKTAEFVTGKPFNETTFENAQKVLKSEIALPENVPGGQAEYRMTLACSFLYKFFLGVALELKKDTAVLQGKMPGVEIPEAPIIEEDEVSGAATFVSAKKPTSRGTQKYPAPKVAEGLEKELYDIKSVSISEDGSKKQRLTIPLAKMNAVGNATPHMSAPLHCTGEALYTDDIPLPSRTLQGSLIHATQCNVTLENIDVSSGLEIPGVISIYTYSDLANIGGDNTLGPIKHDEVLFVPTGDKIVTVGQVLGIVVAETLESAEAGARAVKVTYGTSESKPIISIEDAIQAGSFYDFASHVIEKGDVESVLNSKVSEEGQVVTVSGSFRSGQQEHFYLETNCTLAIPSESDTNLTIYCSTQAANKTQMFCASTTNTPASKVVVRMKRMGGGFGGKESRSVFISCAAAVAAKLSSRPVRVTLGRDVDMSITGARHSFVTNYSASALVTSDGVKLLALDVKLYNNGGCGFDLSGPVMDRALFHVDNCYFWPNFRAAGHVCKTAQPVHTAFRGFGGPQGMAVTEHVIDHLALACNVPGDCLRRNNMYKVGDHTPFGMVMGESCSGKWNIPTMWDRLYQELDFPSRHAAIEEFNSKNKWTKRGVSLTPTKFGIAFTSRFMNQGGALVHLYTDGTILISHGGTEMGQGLHTKVCQVAAQAFGVPLESVYINDTSTDKVANTQPTAASMSTDMYGMATLDACKKILDRLKPIRERLGNQVSLREIANAAFFERIELSATGFFALDESRCGYDFGPPPDDVSSDAPENQWRGNPFNYFTQGVVSCEVEIEVLTGNHRILRSDILVDVGSSINPVIDIGQIEGAFIQGVGWCTLEEVIYADDDHTWIRPAGKVFTSGPGTYKIPAFNDVPEEFNVSLMEDVDNPVAVHSSKAVGEPPFFLGCSVFFAIKEAVRAARSENHNDSYFEMRLPATSERVRMMCADKIAAENIVAVRKNEQDESSESAILDTTQLVSSFQPKGSY